MPVHGNPILIDEEAQKLFEEFGGIDTKNRIAASPTADGLKEAESLMDERRMLLIDLAHLLTSYFIDVRFLEGVKTRKDSFAEFMSTLEKISHISDDCEAVVIRFRGFPTGTIISPKLDYVIQFGNLLVDAAAGSAMFNRMGVKMTHLSGRMSKIFTVLSNNGINTLSVKIPGNSSDAKHYFKVCIDILSRYHLAFKTNAPIVFQKNGRQVTLPLVIDEKGQPDVNLTLTAGLNDLNPTAIGSMVRQVETWMHQSGNMFVSVYEAIFGIKNLKKNLIQPPIEVNNVKWIATEGGQQVVSKEQAIVTRMVMDSFGKSPQVAARAIQTVYGGDYHNINLTNFGDRIRIASGILDRIQGSPTQYKNVEKNVLQNLYGRFEQVNDNIYDGISFNDNVLKLHAGKKETVVGKVNAKLQQMLTFYKGRSVTKKKIKELTRKPIQFDAQDFETIAKDFGIPVTDAKTLVELLKSCFDKDGRFRRGVFEANVPAFVKYEKKVFEFLWHYLKETPHRNDRISFLNALQPLLDKTKQRKRPLRKLITDFLSHIDTVTMADKDAIMLCNLLVRKYNKEVSVEIEITPEEVLLVQAGLDRESAMFASGMIEAAQDRIFQKMRTIHTNLISALDANTTEPPERSYRYLLSLEREIYIFFSLISGETAHSVIRSAIKRYGDPGTGIYEVGKRQHVPLLLPHLKLLVRALSRVGSNEDIPVFDEIIRNKNRFFELVKDVRHRELVERTVQWAVQAAGNIERKV